MRRGTRTTLLAVLALFAFGAGVQLQPAQAAAEARLKAKVGWGPLTSKKAAKKVQGTKWEPRPDNFKPNHTVPTKAELRLFNAKSDMPYAKYVDGQYKGGTDDIIEWAAYKWGLPENLLRAVAVHESWWRMDTLGDNGDSFGLFQVRRPYHCCLPFIRDSTAFNADYYGGIIRAYYDGKQDWLNNPDVAPDNGARYKAGDLWGSLGAWYSGRWRTEGNAGYVAPIRVHLRERTWATHEWFDDK